uniref:Putative ovule protein n=1 Tax=Solanum chacoense TaxID=4108 RepID=A0A0V0H645_SOLCH
MVEASGVVIMCFLAPCSTCFIAGFGGSNSNTKTDIAFIKILRTKWGKGNTWKLFSSHSYCILGTKFLVKDRERGYH